MKTQKALYYEALSIKQSCQLIALCREFQPHVPFDDVVFLELIAVARRFCDPGYFIFIDDLQNRFEKVLKPTVEIIKAKYYFNGFKSNKKPLNGIQFYYINNYVPRVRILIFDVMEGYRPVEKVLFLKIVRACRDFMRAKMSKDAEQDFLQRLSVVYYAMR